MYLCSWSCFVTLGMRFALMKCNLARDNDIKKCTASLCNKTMLLKKKKTRVKGKKIVVELLEVLKKEQKGIKPNKRQKNKTQESKKLDKNIQPIKLIRGMVNERN